MKRIIITGVLVFTLCSVCCVLAAKSKMQDTQALPSCFSSLTKLDLYKLNGKCLTEKCIAIAQTSSCGKEDWFLDQRICNGNPYWTLLKNDGSMNEWYRDNSEQGAWSKVSPCRY
ncbi:MAG: hypothetical protein KAS93_07730 [Gammaproteobacteria bacterium]|nr:hypothetical protein [Gammaproteobacteria bacterium]